MLVVMQGESAGGTMHVLPGVLEYQSPYGQPSSKVQEYFNESLSAETLEPDLSVQTPGRRTSYRNNRQPRMARGIIVWCLSVCVVYFVI